MSPSESPAPDLEPTIEAIRAELRRYGDELVEEAVEALAGLRPAKLKDATHDRIAEAVAEWLALPEVIAAYRNPHRAAPNGAVCPLRVVLNRHARELRLGAVDVLVRVWGFALNDLPPSRIAGEVARRLAAPENAEYLRPPGAPPSPEEVVSDVLARLAAELLPGAVDELSRKWGPDLGRLAAPHLIVEAVMHRLSMPAFAGYLKPGREMPTTGHAALESALARRTDLRRGAADELLRLWAPLMDHLPPARVAGLVDQRLATPACASYLASSQARPRSA